MFLSLPQHFTIGTMDANSVALLFRSQPANDAMQLPRIVAMCGLSSQSEFATQQIFASLSAPLSKFFI